MRLVPANSPAELKKIEIVALNPATGQPFSPHVRALHFQGGAIFDGGYQGTIWSTGGAFNSGKYMALGVQGQKIVVVAPFPGFGAVTASGISGEIGGGISFTGQFHLSRGGGVTASGTWSGRVNSYGGTDSGGWSVGRVAGLIIGYKKPLTKGPLSFDGGYEGSYSGTITTSPPAGITGVPGQTQSVGPGYMAFGVQGQKIVVVAPYQGFGQETISGISGEIGGNITFTGQFHVTQGGVTASGTWSTSGVAPNSGGSTYTASGEWSVSRVAGLSIFYKKPPTKKPH